MNRPTAAEALNPRDRHVDVRPMARAAVSPATTAYSIEIRPYPFLMAIAAIATYLLMSLVKPGRESLWQWSGLSLICTLANYCHFYGVVMSAAFFLSAATMQGINMKSLRPALYATAACLTMSLGILPFVLEAFAVSSTGTVMASPEVKVILFNILKNMYRVVGNPATTVFSSTCVSLLAGIAGLLLAVQFGIKTDRRNSTMLSCLALSLTIALGLVIPSFASLLVQKFNALTPSYSAWIQPVFYVLLAAAFKDIACQGMYKKLVIGSATLLAVFGAAGSSWVFTIAGMNLARRFRVACSGGRKLPEHCCMSRNC